MKKKRISTIVAVILLIALLSGLVAIPGMANTIVYPPVNRVADPVTDARLAPSATPPLNYGEQMGFIDIPRVHDGRIWTDKTVRTGSDVDDFDITLSALSQSFPLTSGYAIPTDTVFVIDVSGSMRTTDAGGGRMRIDVLIEALNGAIEILQDAHPQNRIAVVAYGGGIDGSGLARVERLLPLDRYTAASGSNEYFSFLPSPAISRHHLQVNSLQADVGTNIAIRTVLVNASTPTQWGIYEGSRILETAAPKTAVVPRTDATGAFIENVTVTRRPNIVLMTDGEPTMGWSNYTFGPTPSNPVSEGPAGGLIYSPAPASTDTIITDVFCGDGSWGELGVSLLTVLTAAHRKREVLYSYFGSGVSVGDQPPLGVPGQPGAAVGFFSIAFGTQPDGDAIPLIKATMNPGLDAVYADAITSDTRFRMSDLLTSINGPPPPVGAGGTSGGAANTFKMNPNWPPGWPNPPAIAPNPGPGAPNPLPPLTPAQTPPIAPGYNGNMGELLRQFAEGNMIQFHVSRRQLPFGTYLWDSQPLEITNTEDLTIDEINFADLFETPNNLDELNDVFRQITTNIQMQGIQDTVTNVPGPRPERSFAGYLSFSDVLGEYMQVRSVGGLTYNNTTFSRAGFASAIANNATQRSQYVNILWHHMNYGTPTTSPMWLPEATVANLVASNIASPDFLRNNSLKYYANTNRDFVGSFYLANGAPAPQPASAAAVVEVFPMWGTMNVAPAPPSTQTDLRLITFHVITALRTAGFAELYATNNAGDPMMRILNTGDQMIRWYIPSDLIPIRTPVFDSNDLLESVTGNIHPIRVDFTVGLDRNRVSGDIPPEVFAQYQVPGTTDQMYFYSNRNNSNPTNVTLAFFEPHPNNPFYLGVGSTDMRGVIKTENRTATAPHVSSNRVVAYTAETSYDMHWLGNNGRLTFRLTEPPSPPSLGDLILSKSFIGLPSEIDVFDTNIVSQISFLVVGYNAAGSEIYRETVLFNSTDFRWNDALRRYEYAMRDLPLGNYRIYERGGNVIDYPLIRPGPPYLVSITSTGQQVDVPFTNNYSHNPIPPEDFPALTLWKVFHGLTNTQIPAGFQILITGPGGFSQTINANQAIAGVTYTNLDTGSYTVTEVGNTVPGFNMTVTIDNQARTLPFTFTIESGTRHIGMTIDNYYDPVPPPRPPSPQTGTGSFTLPVVIFLLGAAIIGIAELYRRKSKKKTTGEKEK